MSTQKTIIFDQNSTFNQSGIITVVPGSCVILNAWNLAPGEQVCVDMVRVGGGRIGTGGDSCTVSPVVEGQQSMDSGIYAPCGAQVCMFNLHNMIVLRTPGNYRLTLTPAALGTAVVEATLSSDEDACTAAANECCCQLATPDEINLCGLLNQILPGVSEPGDTFVAISDTGECKLLPGSTTFPLLAPDGTCSAPSYSFASQPSSGMWFDPTMGATGSVVISNNNCANRVDVGSSIMLTSNSSISLMVAALSFVLGAAGNLALNGNSGLANQVLTSAGPGAPISWQPGGTSFPILAPNGSCAAPSYSFAAAPTSGMFYNGTSVVVADENCADFLSLSGAGAQLTSTLGPIGLTATIGSIAITAGNQISLSLSNQLNVNGDAGAANEVLTSHGPGLPPTWEPTGPPSFPLLASSGSCAAPSYSFSASSNSGMWFDPATGPSGSVVISDHNCVNRVNVGASITLVSTATDIGLVATAGSVTSASTTFTAAATGAATMSAGSGAATVTSSAAGVVAAGATSALVQAGSGAATITSTAAGVVVAGATTVTVGTASVTRVQFSATGEWVIGGTPGALNNVIVSQGAGTPPIWAPVTASLGFPLRAPTATQPQYSFAAQVDMGMALDGGQLHFGSLDTVSPVWTNSSRLSIDTGATGDMFLYGSRGDGSRGANLDIRSGNGVNAGGDGGLLQLSSGNSALGTCNDVLITGGTSGAVAGINSVGGDITLTAGDALSTPGSILLRGTAGGGSDYASGGSITLRTDAYRAATGAGAVVKIDHRNLQPYGFNCLFEWPSAPGSQLRWAMSSGDTTTPTGQSMVIRAGIAGNVLNTGGGGNIEIYGGNSFPNGNQFGGSVGIRGGTGNGTSTKGYVQLQRETAAPAVNPTPISSSFCPTHFVDDGATLKLFAWMSTTGTWKSVTLT